MSNPINTYIYEGLLTVRSGSLGGVASGTISAPTILWNTFTNKPTYYILEPTGGIQNVIIPVIDDTSSGRDFTKCSTGHVLYIKNTSVSFALNVFSDNGISTTQIDQISPGQTSIFIAQSFPDIWERAKLFDPSGGGAGSSDDDILVWDTDQFVVRTPGDLIQGTGLSFSPVGNWTSSTGTNMTISLNANLVDLANVTESSVAVGDFLRVASTGSPNQWENFTPNTFQLTAGTNITLDILGGSNPYDPSAATPTNIRINSLGGGGGGSLTQLTAGATSGLNLSPDPWNIGAATIGTNSQTVYNADPGGGAANITLATPGTFRIRDGGLTGDLFVVESNGGTTPYLKISDIGGSVGKNMTSTGMNSISLGASNSLVTNSGTQSIVLTTDPAGGVVNESEQVVIVNNGGFLMANAIDGSGVDFTESNVRHWLGAKVNTTGNASAAFVKTLSIPIGYVMSLYVNLVGARTDVGGPGENWAYKIYYTFKNVAGTVTQSTTMVGAIYEPGKEMNPAPLTISNTDPLVFTVSPNSLTTEEINWVIEAEVIKNKFV